MVIGVYEQFGYILRKIMSLSICPLTRVSLFSSSFWATNFRDVLTTYQRMLNTKTNSKTLVMTWFKGFHNLFNYIEVKGDIKCSPNRESPCRFSNILAEKNEEVRSATQIRSNLISIGNWKYANLFIFLSFQHYTTFIINVHCHAYIFLEFRHVGW